jgi:hypothetical protein
MIDFCPSCGGIRSMSSDVHVAHAHNRMCRCSQLETPSIPIQRSDAGSIAQNVLTEEQIRAIIRDEVAKALEGVKQEEVVRETPVEMARQVRTKRGAK